MVTPAEVRRAWAKQSTEYSPDYYAYYGPNETSEEVRRTLDRFVDRDAAVVELGCSAGRHLKHLHDHGFCRLHGVDVNDDAFDVMAAEYPGLADAGSFTHGTIEDAVRRMDDGQFEAVFSVETLQHVHDDEAWVFEELARITDDVLLTVECESPVDGAGSGDAAVNYVGEGLPLYYRPWGRIFTGLGLEQVAERSLGRDTLRAFRRG